jgi:hypothetical protein
VAGASPRAARARRCCARSPTRSAEHLEELALLEARNAGKPIGDARGEMGMVVDTFRYYAGAPERLLGDTIPVAGGQAFTVREPLGVVGLIVPWNFPLTIAAGSSAGARRRQHGRAQAGRADAADGAALRRAGARGGHARGRRQRRRRPRAHVRASASSSTPTSPRSPSPARPRSVVRSPRARADDQARDARAGRQVRQHDLRRRRPRGGRRGRAVGGVRQRRPGLLRALAHPRRGLGLDRFLALFEEHVKAMRVGDPLDEGPRWGR